jgi:hypothetical protein
MKPVLLAALIAAPLLPLAPGAAHAHDSATVYRQHTPDGRVLYSDKLQRGAKLDETIAVIPSSKGNLWSTQPPGRAAAPERMERTPIDRLSNIPPPGRMKSPGDAEADVIRAEMLLEDAIKRQRLGVEPLPGERTGNLRGGSRLNETYVDRQRRLAEQVQQAEDFLRRMAAEREMIIGRR